MMNNHKFEPLYNGSVTCARCYKPKLDEMHLEFLDANDMIASKLPDVSKEKSNAAKLGAENEPQDHDVRFPPKPKLSEIPCTGHICPNCHSAHEHSYDCRPAPTELHCASCFGQGVSEIHRNEDISRIATEAIRVRTPQDIAARMIEKESFFFLEMTRREDYEQWFSEFLIDVRGKIEDYMADQFAAKAALVKRRKEDMSKLTHEEIEDFKRKAARQKKIKPEKVKPEPDKKQAWKDLCSSLLLIPGMTKEKAETKAAKLYAAQNMEVPK